MSAMKLKDVVAIHGIANKLTDDDKPSIDVIVKAIVKRMGLNSYSVSSVDEKAIWGAATSFVVDKALPPNLGDYVRTYAIVQASIAYLKMPLDIDLNDMFMGKYEILNKNDKPLPENEEQPS